jgi:hypothetical protein
MCLSDGSEYITRNQALNQDLLIVQHRAHDVFRLSGYLGLRMSRDDISYILWRQDPEPSFGHEPVQRNDLGRPNPAPAAGFALFYGGYPPPGFVLGTGCARDEAM